MAFVGNITLTDEHRRVDGYAVVVVIEVMAGAHTPSITTDDAVEGSDRIKHAGGKLMPETGPPALTVVEGKGRGAVEDFSDGNAAEGSGEDVVDGCRLVLTPELPHQTAAEDVWTALPEVKTVGTGTVEVEIAVIGMGKLVGGELVVVPHKAIAEVV